MQCALYCIEASLQMLLWVISFNSMIMSPELHKAIVERKNLGYSEEAIREELVEAGYDNESINLVLSHTVEDLTPAAAVPLPGVMMLLNNALDYVKERYDLALILAAPLVIVSLISYLQSSLVLVSTASLLFMGTAVGVSLITYYFLTLSVLYVVSHHTTTEIPFRDALSWSKRHIFKYAWLSILTGLVIWGGFILFVIPAVVLVIYLYLSQYVLAIEGKTGFGAMARSQQLVSGVWWPVFTRLLGIMSLFVIFFIILGLLFGLSTVSLAENASVLFLVDMVSQLFTGLVTVCSFHIGTQLYQHRAAQVPQAKEAPSQGVLYGLLAGIGLLIVLGLVFFVVTFATQIEDWSNQTVTDYELEESREEAKKKAEELRGGGLIEVTE